MRVTNYKEMLKANKFKSLKHNKFKKKYKYNTIICTACKNRAGEINKLKFSVITKFSYNRTIEAETKQELEEIMKEAEMLTTAFDLLKSMPEPKFLTFGD